MNLNAVKIRSGDFPGGPVAKTPCSQCWGPGFSPWSGNQLPHTTAKSLHDRNKRSSVLQQRPSAAK